MFNDNKKKKLLYEIKGNTHIKFYGIKFYCREQDNKTNTLNR